MTATGTCPAVMWQLILTRPLTSSKTDQFGIGATIIIGKGSHTLCPVQFLAIRPKEAGPLFVYQSNRHLTKQAFEEVKQAMARAGVSSQGYKIHSFRIGAATTAAASGVSESLIKTMGRWSSSAYQLYIRTPPAELVSSQMASSQETYPCPSPMFHLHTQSRKKIYLYTVWGIVDTL